MSDKEEKMDFLEEDTEIPSQRYVCLSFVSPESLIESKEAFKVCKFLQSYCKQEKLDYKELYSNLKSSNFDNFFFISSRCSSYFG